MTDTYSSRELAGIKEVFEVYELPEGKIYARDIGDVLRALDENPTEATIKRFTEKYKAALQMLEFCNVNPLLDLYGINENDKPNTPFPTKHFIETEERVSFDEFLVIYEAVIKHRLTETADEFIESFRHFDKKGNGNIPHDDLRELLIHHGEKMTRGEVDLLLRRQVDDHGNVNIDKFVRKIMANDEEDEGEKSS